MHIRDIIEFIENKFPLDLQESYDNCGLTYGNRLNTLKGILVCLDVTEKVVEEAIAKKCNLIVSHHPVIFQGLKKINLKSMNCRVLEKCIKNDIALYALHTNLDNHYDGVNKEIMDRIGIESPEILLPKSNTLSKLVVYVPSEHINNLDKALFAQGAGGIGDYTECSFRIRGEGSFKPNEQAKPVLGKKGKREFVNEIRAEYLVRNTDLSDTVIAMKKVHPYEQVAYEIIAIENNNKEFGSGMFGELPKEMTEIEFLNQLKLNFNLNTVRHSAFREKKISKVAVCGGSGSFLLEHAKRIKADVLITSDFKYHEFFDAENEILILDIGHWESEQFTTNLIGRILNENFSNFGLHLTEVNTNPVNYF
ncbi:MAG: Nif3-like dinuclear metal center hexameric protein [Flavobacteriales bacterium]|nr:Nif3-like dinuclear metal center hexameric protein [Flavobacteriales bacterium]